MSKRDTKTASHAAWERAHAKGLLRNGRKPVGGTMGNRKSKAAKNKRACRGKVE